MNCNNEIYTGIDSETGGNLQLGTGKFIKNYVVGEDVPTTQSKVIGATQGGATISIVPNVRNTQADGDMGGKVKGFTHFDAYEISFDTNMLSLEAETFKQALGAYEVTTSDFYEELEGRNFLCDSDYIENITWIGKILGKQDPIMVQIFNTVNDAGMTLNSVDGAEGTVAISWKGHYDPIDLKTPPYKVYMPTRTEVAFVEGIVTQDNTPVEGVEVYVEV